jgi:hypothetical protein
MMLRVTKQMQLTILIALCCALLLPVTTYAEESSSDKIVNETGLYPMSSSDMQRAADGTRSIPTTSNPVGNGVQGLRTYANTSFENSTFDCWSLPLGWAYINQTKMQGWSTAHPAISETNCSPPGNDASARVIEIQRTGVSNGNSAFHYLPENLCLE